MPTVTCNACNAGFDDEEQQRLHYRSEWHRYNLKRKVAGVPGVTEALFLARQTALAEGSNSDSTPMLYSCALCGKEYRSSKAHAQHLNSRSHLMKASQEPNASIAGITIVKPRPERVQRRAPSAVEEDEDEDEEEEWVEVDPSELESTSEMQVDEHSSKSDDEMDEFEELDPTFCFMCDLEHDTIENCMVHMHKKHGFFIPDSEYLKDPNGLLIYVGLKVKRDFICLYCNDRCQPFQSLEAVRKHMDAKGHCKVRYGDGGDDEDADLEDFYDYSSSYADVEGKELVAADDKDNIELGSGGAELVITNKSEKGTRVRTLGSREFIRYYRQKPRPSVATDRALALSLASSYKSMGLVTVQSKEQVVRLKVLRAMNKTGVETMRTKIGMKSNVIRNLPKNCPY
ncbi:cytoplasmic 60S subunit biogenesis factor REI1 homolog 1-like [Oryza glaberrima]|uniref:C2H2-type domain-containing protein n=4 Tax=Oryza TaxID=4527 RepID=A0A0D3GK88_9ORYZ|nr:cytoplasmic 60S subunit biogenesis factor REI1 homolog 1-like [Oryza glaberrima]